MDVDLILETIFEEYKAKAIREGQQRKVVEARLDEVRIKMEEKVKRKTDDFIGQPNNEMTRLLLLDAINQDLNQFLDTDIRVDSIEQDAERIDVNLSYRPKVSVSGISVHGAITALSGNPAQDIISLQL